METRLHHFLASKYLPSTIPIHTNPLTAAVSKTTQTHISLPRRGQQCPRINSTDNTNNDVTPDPVPLPTITPPDTVEIRFRRGSRKRNKKRREDGGVATARAAKVPDPPKKWEDMSLSEKAIELYMGEKGMLFWLNKFAYASIFIVIGGWILFRFVGPALNLYQLDTPPLSPTSVLKG
ncbi:hypothetical protein Tsubulata_032329 [Turnera subulata]|uniref:Transmembrane protein n=1 Tax=Turnera subulata TaxID=218843 RepID=A0A9Q0JCJ0_9ROSI|nr:hypothetical protein Tsubulata_032329 [Turnera subulata]